MKKIKWQIFIEKMDSLAITDISEYIKKSRKEARENFKIRDFKGVLKIPCQVTFSNIVFLTFPRYSFYSV